MLLVRNHQLVVMAFAVVVVTVATVATATATANSVQRHEPFQLLRQLPAPCDDFLVPCNVSYHNVATLGIMPREAITLTRADMDELQSMTANEYFGGSFMNLTGPSFLTRMNTCLLYTSPSPRDRG